MMRGDRGEIWRLGVAAIVASVALATSAFAQCCTSADRWVVNAVAYDFIADDGVPGAAAIKLEPPVQVGQFWESGASLPNANAVAAGAKLTAVFWARSDAVQTVHVALRVLKPPYSAFAEDSISLGPEWRRYIIEGAAPDDLVQRAAQLAVFTGDADAAVMLGPVAWLHGDATGASAVGLFDGYAPDHSAEQVRIPVAPGVTLAGTLRLPLGPGPYPMVVFLPGGGPATRGNQTPWDAHLHAEDIGSLTFDKRGLGQSTGNFTDTMMDAREEGEAALAFVRTDTRIDRARIALVGHSQGAVVASAIAADDRDVAAIVSLAGPVGPYREMFLDAFRGALTASGMPEAAREAVVDAGRALLTAENEDAPEQEIAGMKAALIAAYVAAGWPESQATGAAEVFQRPDVVSMFEARPAETLAATRAPVLLVFADGDTVLTSDSLPAAEAALASNADAMIVTIPRVDHGFGLADAQVTAEDIALLERMPRQVALWLAARLVR